MCNCNPAPDFYDINGNAFTITSTPGMSTQDAINVGYTRAYVENLEEGLRYLKDEADNACDAVPLKLNSTELEILLLGLAALDQNLYDGNVPLYELPYAGRFGNATDSQ